MNRISNIVKEVLGFKKEVVGTVTGELLRDWQFHSYEKTKRNLQLKLLSSNFGLQYLEAQKAKGVLAVTPDEVAVAFQTECKEEIESIVKRDKELDDLEDSFWAVTCTFLKLDPDRPYSINVFTGEVSTELIA